MEKLNYRQSLLSDDMSQKSLAEVSEGRGIQAETGGSTRSFFKSDTDRRKKNGIQIKNQICDSHQEGGCYNKNLHIVTNNSEITKI